MNEDKRLYKKGNLTWLLCCEWQLHRHSELNFGLTKIWYTCSFAFCDAHPHRISSFILVRPPSSSYSAPTLNSWWFPNCMKLTLILTVSFSLVVYLVHTSWRPEGRLLGTECPPLPIGGAHLVFCALLATLYHKWSLWCLSTLYHTLRKVFTLPSVI